MARPPTPITSARPAAGLTAAEARERLQRDGPNVLPHAKPVSPLALFLGQLTHFFAVLLWGATVLALLGGMPELAIAIAVVVVVNGGFAFVQEYRADRAAQRLQALLPMRVTVRRDGHRLVISAEDLVVGDMVLLEAGDRVSADLRLASTAGLAVDESTLTGESAAVRPDPGSLVFAGTYVVEGLAEAVVESTGANTRLAGIAALTETTRPPLGPLAVQLHRVVRAVAAIAVSVGVLFFGLSLTLGTPPHEGFLFAVGVTVALVPEGLLPTVTLSLARAAQRMAGEHALVRRLDAVETLGLTTFICSDKTGTLTRNEMTVVEVWTPDGTVHVRGEGYRPEGVVEGAPAAQESVRRLALSAALASTGRSRQADGDWKPVGDPMEVALHVLAMRLGVDVNGTQAVDPTTARFPFDPRRRRMSAVSGGLLHVKGSPDSVIGLCAGVPGAEETVHAMSTRGLRLLAVARRELTPAERTSPTAALEEQGLVLLGIVGIEDPPREGVREAVARCRRAGIHLAVVTGDHPGTAAAIAAEVGLRVPGAPVLEGRDLPEDLDELGELLDHDGVVIARVEPEQKLRIARALHRRGHVVAMTGDGVNDGPALREADIGVAMGRGGTDVAREAADLVLLDDHFATIVAAVNQGRATFANIRRFLTYHLTDNVAELTPFVVWALTGGSFPLAIGVLQVLALDIGTDLLPALALGAEPANPRTLAGPIRTDRLVDGPLLRRVFGVLGPTEALVEMAAFTAVLLAGGWAWGVEPEDALFATASGAAFSAVVLGQLANAYACRSETRWIGMVGVRGNPLLAWAVGIELLMLGVFLLVPPLSAALGGDPPNALGWLVALAAIPAVLAADAAHKAWRARHRHWR